VKLILALLSLPCCIGCSASISALGADELVRLETFQQFWHAIDDRYPYLGRLDADWSELREKYEVSVALSDGPSDFYHVLAGLLSELGDPHVSLTIPRENWVEDGVAATSLAEFSPGLKVLSRGRKAYVESWPEGQEPFAPANLSSVDARYPEIVRIEGFPFSKPLNQIMYRGRPGSPVDLELRWSDGQRTHHTMHRPKTISHLPELRKVGDKPEKGASKSKERKADQLSPGMLTLREVAFEELNKQVAWIQLKSLDRESLGGIDNDVFEQEWWRLLKKASKSDGIILDLQGNSGGLLSLARLVAVDLLAEPALIYSEKRTNYSVLGPLFTYAKTVFVRREWKPSHRVASKPLVVLVNAETASAAEHLTRVLQSHAGALVVGEPTIGVDAGIEEVAGADGSTLKFGAISILSTRGKSFQGIGVLPDISIKVDVGDIRRLGYTEFYTEMQALHQQEVLRAFESLWERQSQATAESLRSEGG
jgi:C-terminal processing protease CtpA/Prc